jgi:hypothetical protein
MRMRMRMRIKMRNMYKDLKNGDNNAVQTLDCIAKKPF